MPYCGSIIRLLIVDVAVIMDIASVVGCKLNLCVYVCIHSWLGASISLISAPAVQAM